MHILALQPNLTSRSAGYATEHDGKIASGWQSSRTMSRPSNSRSRSPNGVARWTKAGMRLSL